MNRAILPMLSARVEILGDSGSRRNGFVRLKLWRDFLKTQTGILSEPSVDHSLREGDGRTKDRLRRIEQREWWLWATAVIITLLLTAGILSFLPPLLRSSEQTESAFTLQRAMWG